MTVGVGEFMSPAPGPHAARAGQRGHRLRGPPAARAGRGTRHGVLHDGTVQFGPDVFMNQWEFIVELDERMRNA